MNDELVQVVWEALLPEGDAYAAGDGPSVEDVLNAVPDGWAKLGGGWMRVEDWRIADSLDEPT